MNGGSWKSTRSFEIYTYCRNERKAFAAFLESVLWENGYITGIYTSPYIPHFSEKIKVNGNEITGGEIIVFNQLVYDAE